VASLDFAQQASTKTFLWEHLVVRLAASGGSQKRVALDARAVWDPDGSTATTALRVGPDGRLYQLRTNPKTGAAIARYSLGRS